MKGLQLSGFPVRTAHCFAALRGAAALCVFAIAGVGCNDVHGQCVCCDAETACSPLLQESEDVPTTRLIQWDANADGVSGRRVLDGFGGGASAPSDRVRLFPIGGQLIEELGFPVPLAFGIGANGIYCDQAFAVEHMEVGISGLPVLPVSLVDIPSLRTRSTTAAVRYDCWLLPFLNVYGITGYTSGITTGEVVVGSVAGLPGLLTIPVRTEFEGPTYGGGITAAIGYKKLFASVDWNYTETNLDIADSAIANELISPRVGLNGPRGSIWVGASYQKLQERLTVSDQLLGLIPIDTVTDYTAARPWTCVYGIRYFLNDHLELFIEHGFSGRNQVMGQVTGRF